MGLSAPARFRLDPRGSDPHTEAARLREVGAVVPVELPGGVGAWLVTRYDVARAVLTDDRFVKDPAAWTAWQCGEVPRDWPLAAFVTVDNMTTATGTDHRRLRVPVSKAFTARRVAALRPRVEATAAALLDRLAALPTGAPIDLRAHFAHPLPIQVISDLLGVPDRDGPQLRALCGALFGALASPQEAAAVHQALRAALAALVAGKRRRPREDLTTALVRAADEDGTRLSESELVDTLLLMIVAGHETTVNLLVNAVRALLGHPGQLALVRSGQRPWSAAVEETLRWDPPVANFPFRYARAELELAGQPVGAGEPVMLAYASFGRDPGQFTDAARFDVTRPAPRHLTFGHGIHHCLGAPLARLEAEVALPALFDRYPGTSLSGADDAQPLASLLFNSTRTLLVQLTPTG